MSDPLIRKIKLTKRAVEAAEPDPQKRTFLWDTEVTGFCVRIYPTGRKTYFLQFRNAENVTRKIKLGVHGNVTTEQAREKAILLSLKINAGEDPSQQVMEQKISSTMADLAHEYLELHASVKKRPRSFKDDQQIVQKYILPRLGSKKLEAITVHELQQLHKELHHIPYQANRLRALLSSMFNKAKEWGWHDENPALNVTKYQEHKRTRFLNHEELVRLWSILEEHPLYITAYVFKFLILTGARKGEALNATWEQINFEKGVWTKPSHLTKQKKTEHLPLSEEAIELLKDVKSIRDSSYVFPGHVPGKPLREIKKFWASVTKRAGLEDVRIHDLRHTYASHLVSQGLSLSIVGKLLGHTQAATTQRYAHLHDAPLRAATALFGRQLTELVSQKEVGSSKST